jgi:hypothetical protein
MEMLLHFNGVEIAERFKTNSTNLQRGARKLRGARPRAVAFFLILISGIFISSRSPSFSLPSAVAQPSKGLNCFACHPREEQNADKGCLICHEGNEIMSERKQAILVQYARHLYGRGEGYECVLCHSGDPAAESKEEAHGGLLSNPASLEAQNSGRGCSLCHIYDDRGNMLTEMPRPGTIKFASEKNSNK